MKIVRVIFLSMIISGVIQLPIALLNILPEMQSKIWGVNVGVITFFITYISFLSSVHFQNKDVHTIINWIAEMLAWIMIFVVYGMIQATFYYLIIH